MRGIRFSEFSGKNQTPFEKLFGIFKELLLHTSGDVDESIEWLRELDKEYNLTTAEYTIDDFLEDLKKKGFLREEIDNGDGDGGLSITAKTERSIRKSALEQVFGKLKKGQQGNHQTNKSGAGDESSSNLKPFQFGDSLNQIDMNQSIKNAYANNGIDNLDLRSNDLVVREEFHKSQLSTVLMIDISHSMILYGEDRITPAKRVALALAEFIKSKYPKDTLDIIVFGNASSPNGPLGSTFMITDGKPSCLHEPDGSYYKNSFGLDDVIVNKCYNRAAACRRANIPITTFMIAQDPYLQQFVQNFTQANKGKAFYTGLKGLGEFIFQDYENNRKRTIR